MTSSAPATLNPRQARSTCPVSTESPTQEEKGTTVAGHCSSESCVQRISYVRRRNSILRIQSQWALLFLHRFPFPRFISRANRGTWYDNALIPQQKRLEMRCKARVPAPGPNWWDKLLPPPSQSRAAVDTVDTSGMPPHDSTSWWDKVVT